MSWLAYELGREDAKRKIADLEKQLHDSAERIAELEKKLVESYQVDPALEDAKKQLLGMRLTASEGSGSSRCHTVRLDSDQFSQLLKAIVKGSAAWVEREE